MTQARKATGSAAKIPSPRQRARAAQAEKLQARRAKEKRVEDALTVAFEELGTTEAARLAVTAAELRLAAALAEVRGLGEKPQEIAEALELPIGEVQRLLKLAEESPAGDDVLMATTA
jgi:DNA-directed RNA polymerase specialized sigma24 family protein